MSEIKTNNVCPECKGVVIEDSYNKEEICCSCGLIISEKNITYDYTQNRKFKGTIVSENSFSPHIFLDTMSNYVKKNNDYKMWRIMRENKNYDYKTINLISSYIEIKRLIFALNLPIIYKQDCVRVFKEMLNGRGLKGLSIEGMISAILFYLCRKNQFPISFKEICELSKCRRVVIKECYKELILKYERPISINPLNYVSKYVTKLNLSSKIEQEAKLILSNFISDKLLNGSSPFGLVGGLIYFVSLANYERRTQKEVAKELGISEITLRKNYNIIKEYNKKKRFILPPTLNQTI